MSRARLSVLTLGLLLVLTGLTAGLAEADASPWLLALVAITKAAVIGWVFLELDQAWPGWAALALVLVLAIAGGAAWLSLGA